MRLSATEWHGVALDECHEMKINKDAKLAVIHTNKYKMGFLSHYMDFCSQWVRNLQKELFPESEKAFTHFIPSTPRDNKREENIRKITRLLQEKIVSITGTGLCNQEGQEASTEQAHEVYLLHCYVLQWNFR